MSDTTIALPEGVRLGNENLSQLMPIAGKRGTDPL